MDALIAFIQQIELSSVAEINSDFLAFLKDCTSNTTAFKSVLGKLLTLATVYGEKLDDCVITEKKKMRKDFGVQAIFQRILIPGNLYSATHPVSKSEFAGKTNFIGGKANNIVSR